MIDVEETTFDLVLRYGLFFGAVFQLVCIGAAIFGSDSIDHSFKVSFKLFLVSTSFDNFSGYFFRMIIVRMKVRSKAARSMPPGHLWATAEGN